MVQAAMSNDSGAMMSTSGGAATSKPGKTEGKGSIKEAMTKDKTAEIVKALPPAAAIINEGKGGMIGGAMSVYSQVSGPTGKDCAGGGDGAQSRLRKNHYASSNSWRVRKI